MATTKRAAAATGRPAAGHPAAPTSPKTGETADTALQGARDRVRGAAVNGVALGMAAAKAATRAASQVTSAGADAVRSAQRAAEPSPAAAGVAGVSVRIPFVSASVRLPAPGATAAVGPVTVTLPTGGMYYGGLAVLVVAGAVELPFALAAGAAGALLGRRWLRGLVPSVRIVDTRAGSSPVAAAAPDDPAPHTIAPE